MKQINILSIPQIKSFAYRELSIKLGIMDILASFIVFVVQAYSKMNYFPLMENF